MEHPKRAAPTRGARRERDRTRGNELTLLGWRVIRVTWEDFQRAPADAVARVRLALSSREEPGRAALNSRI